MIPVNEPLLDGNEKRYLAECIESGWISSEGPFVGRLERGIAERCARKHGIAVCNGTAALELAVAALQLPQGSEVIMPAFTIISCAAAIVRQGLCPVLVDADPATWNMDVNQIEAKITPRTKAIMAVHIYGMPVDMDPLMELARRYKLRVVEDAAEAIGQMYGRRRSEVGGRRSEVGSRRSEVGEQRAEGEGHGTKGVEWAGQVSNHGRQAKAGLRPCGSFGDISIMSFYPNKHITTGEGGMVLTDDDLLAERGRSLRNLCFQKKRFVHDELGWNFRMSNLQAAVGCAQLERLDEFIARKREMGGRYNELLDDLKGLRLPVPMNEYAANSYWVYGVVLEDDTPMDADEAMRRLVAAGVGTRPFFWPMHEQPVFRRMGLFKNEKYPVAERLARRGFYLPSGLALTPDQMNAVVEALKMILAGTKR